MRNLTLRALASAVLLVPMSVGVYAQTASPRAPPDGKCIGDEGTAQRRLDAEHAQLEADSAALQKTSNELAKTALALDAEQASLDQRVQQFEAADAALEAQGKQIGQLQSKGKPTEEEIRNANTLLGALNAAIEAQTHRRDELVRAQETFQNKADAYNEAVRQMNEQVTRLHERDAANVAEGERLRKEVAGSSKKCAH